VSNGTTHYEYIYIPLFTLSSSCESGEALMGTVTNSQHRTLVESTVFIDSLNRRPIVILESQRLPNDIFLVSSPAMISHPITCNRDARLTAFYDFIATLEITAIPIVDGTAVTGLFTSRGSSELLRRKLELKSASE
jgi:hypothetical protein